MTNTTSSLNDSALKRVRDVLDKYYGEEGGRLYTIFTGYVLNAYEGQEPENNYTSEKCVKKSANELIALISNVIHTYLPLGIMATGSINALSKKLAEAIRQHEAEEEVLRVRGSYDAPVFDACVEAEIEQKKAQEKQSDAASSDTLIGKSTHFSNCSIYDESGTEIPNGKCDCGGAVYCKPDLIAEAYEANQSCEIPTNTLIGSTENEGR